MLRSIYGNEVNNKHVHVHACGVIVSLDLRKCVHTICKHDDTMPISNGAHTPHAVLVVSEVCVLSKWIMSITYTTWFEKWDATNSHQS